MSTFNNNNRRVNFSAYMATLNEVPTQEPHQDDQSFFNDDLTMFTNTQFYEVDQPQSVEAGSEKGLSHDGVTSTGPDGQDISLDFNMSDDFSNFDFSTFSTPTHPAFSDSISGLQPLQPSPTTAYASVDAQQNPYGVPHPRPGDKRGQGRQISLEEQSRIAAEEDKRRRNTAASARFRVKKKAREQALEQREKELSKEVETLKNKITSLETENKWLRGLVMEKTGVKDSKFTALLNSAAAKKADEEAKEPAKAPSEKGDKIEEVK